MLKSPEAGFSRRPELASISEKREKAYWEANLWSLPENWEQGSKVRTGIAVDSPETKVKDDAFQLEVLGQGKYMLRLYIPDMSFLDPDEYPFMTDYALELGEARYGDKRELM